MLSPIIFPLSKEDLLKVEMDLEKEDAAIDEQFGRNLCCLPI